MAKSKSSETPLMRQYNQIKSKHPDALLLFRVGDFYETFGEDAVKASKILGIVLTARNNGASKIELAGFPHHSLDTYLPKLVRAGQRVAICDQLEDPKATKKIVKRGVTEVVTPGISFSDKVLENTSNNFLAAVHYGKKLLGVAFLDISTGEFMLAQGDKAYVDKLIQSLNPSEIVCQKNKFKQLVEDFGEQHHIYRSDDWVFAYDYAEESLLKQFGTKNLKGFGIDDLSDGIIAAGAILNYVQVSQYVDLGHINHINRLEEDTYVWLDRFTIRNLELIYSTNPDACTLIDVLDYSKTAMGGRLMKRWMLLPLKDKIQVERRHAAVNAYLNDTELHDKMQDVLSGISDLERLISRAAVGKITPRELNHLAASLEKSIEIKNLIGNQDNALSVIAERIESLDEIRERIKREIEEEAPMLVSKGRVIKDGVSPELDDLREIRKNGKAFLDKILERETKNTGIPSLKIAYNNVFGYYLEVRNAHKDKVPEEWIRKQTLTQAERYITEELKEYEQKILGAEEKILGLESKLFEDLVRSLGNYIHSIQVNAQVIAELDCLLGFATCAKRNNYVMPEMRDDFTIEIEGGRHPVIEHTLPVGEAYIPNNVFLDRETCQIMMITGPNMSGKSALLRQTALISLMAQIGSFVPATSAKLGIVDKIFTRVGASDNISSGESTFMVEMNETASILNNISDRSLILLDEIGRGTSTYDGVSIAWSIAEYIHQHPTKAKTLFATHYHELNDMTNTFERIKNFNVSIKEHGSKIIFMRKLVEGGSAHSFGIHVAKMAGMPEEVVSRANQVLKLLESSRGQSGHEIEISSAGKDSDDMQLSFFQLDDPVLSQIRDDISKLDIDNLTPVEALMKLNEIKKLTGA